VPLILFASGFFPLVSVKRGNCLACFLPSDFLLYTSAFRDEILGDWWVLLFWVLLEAGVNARTLEGLCTSAVRFFSFTRPTGESRFVILFFPSLCAARRVLGGRADVRRLSFSSSFPFFFPFTLFFFLVEVLDCFVLLKFSRSLISFNWAFPIPQRRQIVCSAT